MTRQSIGVLGTDVLIEGPENGPVLLFLHGWPDTRELWQQQVDAFKGQYRCVRFTWPSFVAGQANQSRSFAEHLALVDAVVDRMGGGKPVTLVLHDWGSIFGQQYAAKHPTKVCRMVVMDVGDYNSGAYVRSLSTTAKLGAAGYQLILALTWVMGQRLGLHGLADAITRKMARLLHAPGAAQSIHNGMNLPYAMTWFKTLGGFKGDVKLKQPSHPMLYLHGLKKPFQFQSPRWLETVAAQHGGKVVSLDTGHWLMLKRVERVNEAMRDWLNGSDR
jgi:cis-3-alkyl-4-acyloxetan-2-one decarboxylase